MIDYVTIAITTGISTVVATAISVSVNEIKESVKTRKESARYVRAISTLFAQRIDKELAAIKKGFRENPGSMTLMDAKMSLSTELWDDYQVDFQIHKPQIASVLGAYYDEMNKLQMGLEKYTSSTNLPTLIGPFIDSGESALKVLKENS